MIDSRRIGKGGITSEEHRIFADGGEDLRGEPSLLQNGDRASWDGRKPGTKENYSVMHLVAPTICGSGRAQLELKSFWFQSSTTTFALVRHWREKTPIKTRETERRQFTIPSLAKQCRGLIVPTENLVRTVSGFRGVNECQITAAGPVGACLPKKVATRLRPAGVDTDSLRPRPASGDYEMNVIRRRARIDDAGRRPQEMQ